MIDPRWEFLHEEILAASVMAGFMFGQIYEKGCLEDSRLRVRSALKTKLRGFTNRYAEQVTGNQHIKYIEELADEMSNRFPECLRGNRFRIGIAQKVLNLYLKYLWCHERIPTPPHCPFDGVIIGLLPREVRKPYTQVNDIKDYVVWVEAAEVLAQGEPLAVWELRQFERMRSSL